MAMITNLDLADLRRKYARKIAHSGYTKPIINAGLQAIEDWNVGGKGIPPGQALYAQINVATAPFIFTNPEKDEMIRTWHELDGGRST